MECITNSQEAAWLLSAFTGAAALGAAVQTGLLWRLAVSPHTADAIAHTLSIPPQRCRHWLELLQMMGVLADTAQGYVLSDPARTAIADGDRFLAESDELVTSELVLKWFR